METITFKYGDYRAPETVIPLLEEPVLELVHDYGNENSIILVNGVECELDSLYNYIGYERLGFCGCGMPEEMRRFWYDQLKTIVNDTPAIDYIGYAGGVNFFIEVAKEQGVLNENKQLTPFGKLAFLTIEKYIESADVPVGEVIVTPVPSYTETPADQFNYESMKTRFFILKALGFVGYRNYMEKPGVKFSDTYYEVYEGGSFRIPDGAYYWLYHVLDGQYPWMEHGGSAPGWLTAEGREVLDELVKEFGVRELDIFDLIEKGFVFSKSHIEDILPLKPTFTAVLPEIDWEYVFMNDPKNQRPFSVSPKPFDAAQVTQSTSIDLASFQYRFSKKDYK